MQRTHPNAQHSHQSQRNQYLYQRGGCHHNLLPDARVRVQAVIIRRILYLQGEILVILFL